MSAESELRKIVTATIRAANRAEIAALKSLEGAMKVRIHQYGEDERENLFGAYSPGWAKVRKKRFKQTDFVDLDFEGDLIKGYKLGKTIDRLNALGFVDDWSAQKARDNEHHFGKTIFSPTEPEWEEAEDTYVATFVSLVKQLV